MDTSSHSYLTLVRRKQVEAITGLKRSSIYALMQRGEFPRPVKLSARSVGWPLTAVEEWIRVRMGLADSSGATAATSQTANNSKVHEAIKLRADMQCNFAKYQKTI